MPFSQNPKEKQEGLSRVFFAATLDNDTQGQITDFLHQHKKSFNNLPVRWVPEKNYHITLVFMPFLTQSQLQQLRDAVESIFHRTPSFTMSLGPFMPFPSPEKPRGLTLLVPPNKILEGLVNDLEAAITGLKIPMSAHNNFRAHITLAKTLKHAALELPPIQSTYPKQLSVTEITLFKSNPEEEVGRYRPLGTFPLGGVRP